MNSYNMRALSLGGDPIIFSIADVPMRISANEFVLSLKPNSPILRWNTISRGMDVDGLFEGDVLSIDGKEYTISYLRGFVAFSEDRDIKRICDVKDIPVSRISSTSSKTLQFKYREQVLNILNIVGPFGNYAVLNNIKGRIDPTEIQQDAGFTINKKRIFYGDTFHGHTVTMIMGRACVNIDGEIYDISTNKKNQRGDFVCSLEH